MLHRLVMRRMDNAQAFLELGSYLYHNVPLEEGLCTISRPQVPFSKPIKIFRKKMSWIPGAIGGFSLKHRARISHSRHRTSQKGTNTSLSTTTASIKSVSLTKLPWNGAGAVRDALRRAKNSLACHASELYDMKQSKEEGTLFNSLHPPYLEQWISPREKIIMLLSLIVQGDSCIVATFKLNQTSGFRKWGFQLFFPSRAHNNGREIISTKLTYWARWVYPALEM